MKVDYAIIPECYVDTNLNETITGSFNRFNHQKSCNEVSKAMQSPKLVDSFALGIIDKGKKAIRYLDDFNCVCSSDDLFLFKHPHKHHYIIQISPAIEKFILKSAEGIGINLEDFGLPNEFEELKKTTKTNTSRNNPALRKLFLEMKNKKAPQLMILAKWVSYLKTNTYNSNIADLINIH